MADVEVPINVITEINNLNELNNVNTGNEASGGISRWLIYTIIVLVVAAVVGLVIFIVKKVNNKKRESGQIIQEVSQVLTENVDKKVANDLLDVALRARTEQAQLEANSATSVQLAAVGKISQSDADMAIKSAADAKIKAEQANIEAAKAIENIRKQELDNANKAVAMATTAAAAISATYQDKSKDIIDNKLKEAEETYKQVVQQRQLAEKEYNASLATRRQAERNVYNKKVTEANETIKSVKKTEDVLKVLDDKIKQAKKATDDFKKKNRLTKINRLLQSPHRVLSPLLSHHRGQSPLLSPHRGQSPLLSPHRVLNHPPDRVRAHSSKHAILRGSVSVTPDRG
ncbi:hypothetical protein PBCVKS1B_549L [Paramecium bursaria Chlorella virus KS1B]|nr:hypothetical protein PBCVKS1B_549L [Paramecium bursaria Chlorella virus KS1B]